MAKTFRFTLNRSAETVFEHARQEGQRMGASVTGDHNSGSFSHPTIGVKGSYIREGQDLVLTVDEMPFPVPDAMIKGALERLFS